MKHFGEEMMWILSDKKCGPMCIVSHTITKTDIACYAQASIAHVQNDHGTAEGLISPYSGFAWSKKLFHLFKT